MAKKETLRLIWIQRPPSTLSPSPSALLTPSDTLRAIGQFLWRELPSRATGVLAVHVASIHSAASHSVRGLLGTVYDVGGATVAHVC